MNNENFGEYIRKARAAKSLPLRKVAAILDIDTSTLSKVERGERLASTSYLTPLAKILQLELKEVQTKFIVEKITRDFEGLEFLTAGLRAAEKELLKIKTTSP